MTNQNSKGPGKPRVLYVVARAAAAPGSPWTVWAVPANGAEVVSQKLRGQGTFTNRQEAEAKLAEIQEERD